MIKALYQAKTTAGNPSLFKKEKIKESEESVA